MEHEGMMNELEQSESYMQQGFGGASMGNSWMRGKTLQGVLDNSGEIYDDEDDEYYSEKQFAAGGGGKSQ